MQPILVHFTYNNFTLIFWISGYQFNAYINIRAENSAINQTGTFVPADESA